MKIKNTNDIPSLVRKFMPSMEQRALIGSVEHDDILKELSERIEKMPKSYETDGQGKAAIVYLHYFKGDSHFYITEKDVEDEQHQAYGLTVLNGDWMNAEMGYISIEELKEYQFELDLFWKPISIKEVRENKEKFSSGGSVEGNAEIEKALMYLQDNLQEKRGEKITKITTAERKENKIKPVWKYEIKEVDEHGNVRPDSDIINRYLSNIGLLEYATENGMKRVSYLTDEKKSNILAAYQYIKKHGAKTAQEKTFVSELGYKKQGTESNYTFSDKGLEQIYERFFKDLPVELQNLSLKFKDGESVYLKNVQNMKGNVGFMNQSNGMWYVKFKDGSDGYFSDEDLEKENGMVKGGAISEDGYYEKISYQNSIKNNLFTVRKFDSSGMEFKTPEFGVFMNGKHIDNARTLQEAKDLINNDTYYSDGGSLDSISSKYPDLKKGQLYTSWYRGEENSFYVYDVDGDDLTIRVNGVNTKKTVKQFEDFIELYKLVPQYKMEEVDLDSISKQEIRDAVKQGYNEIRVGVIDRNTTETGVMLVKGNVVFKAYQLKYKAEIADIIKDEKSKEDGGFGVQEPKEITEEQATELFNKGIVVYIQAGHGILDTSQNVFSFSNKSFDASLNMYIGGRHPNEVPFDEILAFIRDREDFDLKFYTLNSERSWILEGGKTFEKGGELGFGDKRFTKNDYDKLIDSGEFEGVREHGGRNNTESYVIYTVLEYKGFERNIVGSFSNTNENIIIVNGKTLDNPLVKWLKENSYLSSSEIEILQSGGDVEQDEDDKKYIWKHRHTKGITAEILERTENSFKVKQTEEYEAWGDNKLKTPKLKTEVYKQQEFIDLFTIDRLKPEYLKTGGNMDIRGDKNPNFIYNILRHRKGKRVIVFSGEEQKLRDGILEVNPENDKDYDVNGVSFDLSRIDYIVPPLEHGIDFASIYLKLNDKLKTGGDVKKQPEWLFIGQYPNAVVYADKTFDDRESGDYHSIARVILEPLEIKVYDHSAKYKVAVDMAKEEYLELEKKQTKMETTKLKKVSNITKNGGFTHKDYDILINSGEFKGSMDRDFPSGKYDEDGFLILSTKYRIGDVLGYFDLRKEKIIFPFDKTLKNPLVVWLKENSYISNSLIEIMEEGGLINTEEIVADPANKLEDVSVKNADISAAEYIPKSIVCETLDTVAPISMLYEMNKSLTKIDREVRGIDQYVMGKLGYSDLIEMCRSFSAEQVDAIANAIYQIEKGQALIIGDMVGIGKGRCAAAIMRYAIKIGKTPIFFTAKPNLFSDIYRDLIAIGSDDAVPVWFKGKEIDKVRKVTKTLIENAIKEDIENGDFELDYNSSKLFTKGYEKETEDCVEEYRDLYYPNEIMKESSYTRNDDYAKQIKKSKRIVPFIVNGRSSKTEIKDSDGNVLYEGVSNTKPDYTLRNVFESRKLPKGYDAVLLTYSQVNSPTRAKEKAEWLMAMATDNIVICDESHLASGSSNTGKYLQGLLNRTAGVVFLSATFAKRPDNMPIYAMKTAIQDAEMDNDTLVAAITSGGVALQEILANELVSEGQMLRRERSYDGVVVNYNYLDERMLERDVPLPNFNLRETHEAVSDTVTNIIRKIIVFQKDKVNPIIANKDEEFKEQQIEAGVEKQNIEGGIGNPPIFSGIFNLINQLLFSIKAEAVADFAIQRMKEGKKVIIGFSSTLESFLDYLISEETDKIKTDFSVILKRRLEKTLEYTIKHPTGDTEKMALDPNEYPTLTDDYNDILKDIRKASTGITISPIDVIVKKIKDAGFKIGEVTGRKKQVKFLEDGVHGKIESRVKEPVNDMFRKFNDNELDCLLINQSGSTGASAHSIETKKVYVVNHNEDGTPKIPTSLEPRNEVKQRVMIILQAELDINQEVQKRGRINRTGQVFKPIYDYVISAIPAEERLMMMLQKKLKSLDANTTSNQKQSKKLLDVVDFLNVYGDMKVVQFLKDNPQYNDMTGNILKFEFGNPTEDTNKIEDKAHKVSGRVAILPVELQSNFYKTVSEGYGNLETQLRQSGEWNLEVENMDLDAKLIRKDVVSVGNPEKSSVFGEAVFMERCSVNNLRKPYKQSEVENLIANALTFTTPQGKVLNFNPETKMEFLVKKFLDNAERSKESQLQYADIKKENDLKGVAESPSLLKKTKTEAKEYIAEKTAAIEAEYELRVKSIESSSKNIKQLIVGNLEYFKVRRLMAYPLAKYDENGEFIKAICLGIDVNFNTTNPFAPSQMTARFILPNGMRMMKITLSDSFINKIKAATENDYSIRTADERDVDTFIEEWDVETKESRANRVNRYIVTGNILKGYGNADFRTGGKLISYTVEGGGVKKGILLPDNFEAKDIRVKIPINKALNYIQGMTNGTSLLLYGTDVTMQRRSNFYHLYVKKAKNPLSDIVNDADINSFSFEDKWNYSKGEFTNQFELPTIKKLVSILWEKYKINISIPVSAFEAIKDQFDIEEREKSTDDGTEELIKKHNKMLEEYERSKKFTEVDEKEFKKYDEIEKENYELKKQVAELEAMKRLYKVTSLLEADIRKKKREAAELAGQAQMETGGGVGDDDDDLFEHQEYLPTDVKLVLDKYAAEENTYENCQNMLAELEPLGYTFEFYLDAEPSNLRKM